jgi:hypothetical protein
VTDQPASIGAAGETPSGVTTAPNLSSESMPSSGTVVFSFDRPVTAPSLSAFHLYESGASGTEIGCGSVTAGSGATANQVTCTYAVGANPVTLGTVGTGAVTGAISGSSGTSTNTSVFSAAA